MNLFLRCLYVEYRKTKHLSHLRMIHILIPAGIAAVFLIYYRQVNGNTFMKMTGYFQVLGIGLPFLTGLFCSMTAQQEQSAGAFQNMLAVPFRPAVFYGKLGLFVLMGSLAVFAACLLFGVGWMLTANEPVAPLLYENKMPAIIVCCLYASGMISVGGLWLYIFHLYLSFRFAGQLSIILGVLESLGSAVLLTGLGDGIWMYLPCAWPSRLVSQYLAMQQNPKIPQADFFLACMFCLCGNLLALLAFGIWSCRFEGRKT